MPYAHHAIFTCRRFYSLHFLLTKTCWWPQAADSPGTSSLFTLTKPTFKARFSGQLKNETKTVRRQRIRINKTKTSGICIAPLFKRRCSPYYFCVCIYIYRYDIYSAILKNDRIPENKTQWQLSKSEYFGCIFVCFFYGNIKQFLITLLGWRVIPWSRSLSVALQGWLQWRVFGADSIEENSKLFRIFDDFLSNGVEAASFSIEKRRRNCRKFEFLQEISSIKLNILPNSMTTRTIPSLIYMHCVGRIHYKAEGLRVNFHSILLSCSV